MPHAFRSSEEDPLLCKQCEKQPGEHISIDPHPFVEDSDFLEVDTSTACVICGTPLFAHTPDTVTSSYLSTNFIRRKRQEEEERSRPIKTYLHKFTPLDDDPNTCATCLFVKNMHELTDKVNHPAHYTAYKGLEIIDLTEQMNFNRGNAVKYIARAGLKDPEKTVEDLEKARWYIDREIQRLVGE